MEFQGNSYPLALPHRLHLTIFPPSCRACGRIVGPPRQGRPGYPFLCAPCWLAVPWVDPDYSCGQCGARTAERHRRVCPACAESEWALDGVHAACHYEEPLRRWILGLKFTRQTSLRRLLGLILALGPTLPRSGDEDWLMVPVPLHRRRLRSRGFNQSYVLAHAWRAMQIQWGHSPMPLSTRALTRHRHTLPQVELPAAERSGNVAGAFSVPDSAMTAGRPILLVDDIMTSGATLNACADALKAAGARAVRALVLART